MRIAKVVGTVTLNRAHPSLQGGRFKLAVPQSKEDLLNGETNADEMVVYDDSGVGIGDQIMLSEGGEAAQPFYPELKPIDAYNAGILDNIEISE